MFHGLRIAAVIPAFNEELAVGATVRSVPDFVDHVIVVDDASADDTDRGFSTSLLACALAACAPGPVSTAPTTSAPSGRQALVAFLDSDDLWTARKLGLQLKAFEETGADLVFTDGFVFRDEETGDESQTFDVPRGRMEGPVLFDRLFLHNHVPVLSVALRRRRDAIVGVGMFDESLECAEDYDLWLRLARAGARMAYQRKVLCHRRIHADNLSGDDIKLCESVLQVLERLSAGTPLRRAERIALDGAIRRVCGELALERGKQSIARGDFNAARRALANANHAYRSWRWRSWKLKITRLGLELTPGLLRQADRLREQRQLHRTQLDAPRMSRL